MIQNINTLQNLPESAGLRTYTDLYLTQSLANLGQRFSIKGDGLSTGEFSICDILLNSPMPLDIDKDYKNAYAHINVETKDEESTTTITLTYVNNDVESEHPIVLTGALPLYTEENIKTNGSPINNVEYYEEGGYINKLDNEYFTAFAGYNNSNEIAEITIDSFIINSDISSRLNCGLRFFKSSVSKDINIGEKIYSIRALLCKHINKNEYSFSLYDVNYDDTFEKFKEEVILKIIKDITDLNIDNIIKILSENGYISEHIDKEGKAWKQTCFYEEGQDGALTFNLTPSNLENDLAAEVQNITIMFSYDITVFYNFITEYYNTKIYFIDDDNLNLKKDILIQLVLKIFNDYKKEYELLSISKNEDYVESLTDYIVHSIDIYLPLNYKFLYNCNSNNQLQIYDSVSDILVEFTENLNGEIRKIQQGEKSEQLLICYVDDTSSIDNKFKIYSFAVTYTRDNIVDDINIIKKFTLPYIDDNGYWCINDISTSIYAKGKDGGQPNIIITYTDTSNDVNKNIVLSSFKKDEISSMNWAPKNVRVKPLDSSKSINVAESSYHILKTMMPTDINILNENLITSLEHALILNINSVNSEIKNDSKGEKEKSSSLKSLASNLGSYAIVPTFWALDKTWNETSGEYNYEFTYIKQPDTDWALDMNYLTNINYVVQYYTNLAIEPDNYEHSWVVFDRIDTSFKNTDALESVWPVIINQDNSKYIDIIGDNNPPNKYNNNLNMTIGFFDNIQKTQNKITTVDQNKDKDTKYFPLIGGGDGEPGEVEDVVFYTKYAYEYIPNAVVTPTKISVIPFLDLSEVFVRNQSTFNRQNILTVSKDRKIYNAYIGSAYNLEDKSILHIGSSNVNPNIGETTLMTHADKEKFGKINQIDIDFDKIYLNGSTFTDGYSWKIFSNENKSIKAWHLTTPICYIGELSESKSVDSTEVLMSYKSMTIMKEVTIKNNITIPEHKENISYINLNYFFDKVAKVDGYNKDNCEFRGDFVYNDNDSYFLQLQTDISQSYLMRDTDNTKIYLTNPIDFLYTKTDEKMIVSVREIVSNLSQPAMYNNGTI